MTTVDTHRLRTAAFIGIASVILGVGTTTVLALTSGGMGAGGWPRPVAEPWQYPAPSCAVPALPGSVVSVTATDMGAMMGRRHGGMGAGMMRLFVDPVSVPAGPVSLRVANRGWLTHEVVVLPLAPGQYPGQRRVGPTWQVDESGSLGEASQTCGGGEGDGIAPGSLGWATLKLPAGRYELVCNIAGHYSSGMYAELDVT